MNYVLSNALNNKLSNKEKIVNISEHLENNFYRDETSLMVNIALGTNLEFESFYKNKKLMLKTLMRLKTFDIKHSFVYDLFKKFLEEQRIERITYTLEGYLDIEKLKKYDYKLTDVDIKEDILENVIELIRSNGMSIFDFLPTCEHNITQDIYIMIKKIYNLEDKEINKRINKNPFLYDILDNQVVAKVNKEECNFKSKKEIVFVHIPQELKMSSHAILLFFSVLASYLIIYLSLK